MRVARHLNALTTLRERGVTFSDGFEDPIGPNWFYVRAWNVTPANGHFFEWFARVFCVTGWFRCTVEGTKLNNKDWALLRDLWHLEHVSVFDDENVGIAAHNLRSCRDLWSLSIVRCKLTQSDIDQVARMQKLRLLRVVGTSIGEADLQLLKKQLPDCKIVVE
jgi:hypothetical protein